MSTLDFDALPPAWVLGLVIVPGLIALAAWAYRARHDRAAARQAAWVLRAALLLLVALLGFGPYLRRDETRSEPAPLAFLLDDSASMATQDEGLEGSRQARVSAWLAGGFAARVQERYALEAWEFADRLAPTAVDGSGLQGRGHATGVADALLALADEHRGGRVPDVVLVSDGRSNSGVEPATAIQRLRAEGVQVHTVLVGRAQEAPDLALERVQAPDQLISGDVGLLTLRLRAAGEGLPADATVRLLDADGALLDETQLPTPGEEGATFTLSARLDGEGTRRIVARVEPAAGETALANNEIAFAIEVRRVKLRVLLVEGRPRWEYTFLQRRLTRAEMDVQLQCWLADVSPGFEQEHSRDAAPLLRLPVTAEELLDSFDVVILGEADPARLTRDPLDGGRFLDALADFVQRGGGLLLLAGPRHNPRALIGTDLEPMLPVIVGREAPPPAGGLPAAAARPAATASGGDARVRSAAQPHVVGECHAAAVVPAGRAPASRRQRLAGARDAGQRARALRARRQHLRAGGLDRLDRHRRDLALALPRRRALPRALLARGAAPGRGHAPARRARPRPPRPRSSDGRTRRIRHGRGAVARRVLPARHGGRSAGAGRRAR